VADKSKVLVVASRTAESPQLLEALDRRAEQGDVEFTMLVPATPHGLAWAANMHAGEAEAAGHLDGLVERLRTRGLDVGAARVGDPDPLAATQDETARSEYDEVIVSTLPHHLSKWLKLDLPSKVGHATGLPVEHVETR
jgi:hypothetical protein